MNTTTITTSTATRTAPTVYIPTIDWNYRRGEDLLPLSNGLWNVIVEGKDDAYEYRGVEGEVSMISRAACVALLSLAFIADFFMRLAELAWDCGTALVECIQNRCNRDEESNDDSYVPQDGRGTHYEPPSNLDSLTQLSIGKKKFQLQEPKLSEKN